MTDQEIQAARNLLPVVNEHVYFDHASTGPMPSTAVAAIAAFARYQSEHGQVPYAECEAVVEETRSLAAQLMHVSPSEIAFTKNTSSGIIFAINSMDWNPGDNLVMMKDAFPTNSYPFHYLLPQVEKRYVTSEELASGPDCVFQLIDRRTRLVSLDWVHFLTGVQADIQAVSDFCRPLGIRFLIDAIQGLGVVDTDFSRVDADFACATTAKWLLSPQGIALLHVNPRTLPKLKPTNLGWLSAQWDNFNDIYTPKALKPGASRFEEGTKNYLGIYGLRESLKLILSAGLARVEQRIRLLTGRLRAGLTKQCFNVVTPDEPNRSAGIVTGSRPGTDMTALHSRLTAAKFVCSLREDLLRISPHFYNTEQEVDRLVDFLSP